MPIFKKFNNELLEDIKGVSYVGKPKNNTMMYMSKKIESKLLGLTFVNNCLVFIENNISVPDNIVNQNNYVLCAEPAASYTEIATILYKRIEDSNRKKRYSITPTGYFVGEDVIIGKNTYIEPGVLLDHGIKIGDNVTIKTGAKIRSNTIIGNNCSIGENTVIGEPAFNMTTLTSGKVVAVPCFGGVVLNDNVYIGANTSISRGGADDTVLEEDAKVDSNVRIGHDAILHKAVEVTASSLVAGYCEIGFKSFIGLGAVLRNRVQVGNNSFIAMGSVVVSNVDNNTVVCGVPAKFFKNKSKG